LALVAIRDQDQEFPQPSEEEAEVVTDYREDRVGKSPARPLRAADHLATVEDGNREVAIGGRAIAVLTD
jgi:DnaJ-domain-containing protein 1